MKRFGRSREGDARPHGGPADPVGVLTDAPVSKARVVAKLLKRPPEIREEETAPTSSIGLADSQVIGGKKP